MEGDEGLACAGGQGEQEAVAAGDEGVDGAVHGDDLVIAWELGIDDGAMVGLVKNRALWLRERRAHLASGAETLEQRLRRGEIFHREMAYEAGEEVIFHEFAAIGGVGEGNIQDGRVVLSLLQAIIGGSGGGFGLDDGERRGLGAAPKQEVYLLERPLAWDVPLQSDTPGGEGIFKAGQRVLPSRALDGRGDETMLHVLFRQGRVIWSRDGFAIHHGTIA